MINISTGAVLSHLRKVKLNQEKRLIAQLWFKKSCSIITLLFEYSCNISFCGCSIYYRSLVPPNCSKDADLKK